MPLDKESEIHSGLRNQNLLIVALVFSFLLFAFVEWNRGAGMVDMKKDLAILTRELGELEEFHKRQVNNDRGRITAIEQQIEQPKEHNNARNDD